MAQLALDHIVISARDLDTGAAYLEDALGVSMAPGGKHPAMGTHNRLLGLGGAYLEVIAIDPSAPAPATPRWFDLDNFRGAPRLTNWVAQTADLPEALKIAPEGSGVPTALSRGDLTWDIALSDDGTLPFQGAFPGLIAWGTTPHPTARLPDVGCRLEALTITCPGPAALRSALARFDSAPEVTLQEGPFALTAEIRTPTGRITLS